MRPASRATAPGSCVCTTATTAIPATSTSGACSSDRCGLTQCLQDFDPGLAPGSFFLHEASGGLESVRVDLLAHLRRVPDAPVHGDVDAGRQRLHGADSEIGRAHV